MLKAALCLLAVSIVIGSVYTYYPSLFGRTNLKEADHLQEVPLCLVGRAARNLCSREATEYLSGILQRESVYACHAMQATFPPYRGPLSVADAVRQFTVDLKSSLQSMAIQTLEYSTNSQVSSTSGSSYTDSTTGLTGAPVMVYKGTREPFVFELSPATSSSGNSGNSSANSGKHRYRNDSYRIAQCWFTLALLSLRLLFRSRCAQSRASLLKESSWDTVLTAQFVRTCTDDQFLRSAGLSFLADLVYFQWYALPDAAYLLLITELSQASVHDLDDCNCEINEGYVLHVALTKINEHKQVCAQVIDTLLAHDCPTAYFITLGSSLSGMITHELHSKIMDTFVAYLQAGGIRMSLALAMSYERFKTSVQV